MRIYSFKKANRSIKQIQLQRCMRIEPLESRHLMAGLVTPDANYNPTVYSTNAAGLPLLHGFSSAKGAAYLDYDGFDSNGDGDWDDSGDKVPYDRDGDPTTFSVDEQATIVNVVRKVSMALSMFDIDVTTVQPTTKPFSWLIMTSSTTGGGLASLGSFGNPSGPGNNRANGNSPYIVLHELGHTFGIHHDSTYDTLGVNVDEYGAWNVNIDYFHGMIMGEHDGALATYNNWHTTISTTNAQDDLAIIAAKIFSKTAFGDGYRTDFGNNSVANASAMHSIGGNSTSDWDSIERKGDIDYYKLTPTTTGYYSFLAARDGAVSPVNLKLSILNSTGSTVLASEDGDPKVPFTTDIGGIATPLNYDQHLRVWLTAGTTYVVKIEGHGNYSDLGQYALRSDLLGTTTTDKWQSEDLGFNGVGGYTDINSGVFTVAGSGYDLDVITEDSGQFVYQTLKGNGEIIAHVASLDNDGGWAGSGVMMRESLAATSRAVSIVNSTAGTYAVTRSTTGGTSASIIPATAYTWLRIVRSGTTGETFTTYGKVNIGDTWTQIGTNTITGLTGDVHLGLVSIDARRKAFQSQTLAVGTLDNVSIVLATGTNAGVLNPDLTTNALTIPTITVGTVTNTSVSISWNNVSGDNGYIVERSSDRINWSQISGALSSSTLSYVDNTVNEAQTYYYLVRAKTGTTSPAYSVRATGTNQPGTSITTKAGPVTDLRLISVSATQIMLDWREASGEASYSIMRRPTGSGSYVAVATGVAANTTVYVDSGLTTNTGYDYKVRTVRPDGTTVDTAAQTVYTRRTAEVTGLGITARTTSSLTLSWNAYTGATSYLIYKREAAGGDGQGGPWTYGETSVLLTEVTAPTTTYIDTNSMSPLDQVWYFVVAKTATGASTATAATTALSMVPTADTLPSPWTSYDTGPVGGPGAFKLYPDDDLITLYSAGTDIYGTNDAYRNLTSATTGINEIFGKVTSNQGGYAGLMIRESDSPTSRYVFIGEYKSGSTGGFIEIRATAGAMPTETTLPNYTPGTSLLSLYRNGNQIKGYLSNNDGASWALVVNITMSGLSSTVLYQLIYTNTDTTHFEGADFTMVSTMQDGPLFPPSLLRAGGSSFGTHSLSKSSESGFGFPETARIIAEPGSKPFGTANGSFVRAPSTPLLLAENRGKILVAITSQVDASNLLNPSRDQTAGELSRLSRRSNRESIRVLDAFFSSLEFDI